MHKDMIKCMVKITKIEKSIAIYTKCGYYKATKTIKKKFSRTIE